MSVSEPKEGYFKFTPCYAGGTRFPEEVLSRLGEIRSVLYRLGLIGVYAEGELKGVGFGNLSARTDAGFVVTATRTGGLAELEARHYTEITHVDLDRNAVKYRAVTEEATPSSECMTHAMFYQADPSIGAVIHVHHLAFWRYLLDKVPATSPDVAYGTPAMAREILRLYRGTELPRRRLAAMAGHEEGIISFGRDLECASTVLLDAFRAWQGE